MPRHFRNKKITFLLNLEKAQQIVSAKTSKGQERLADISNLF
jgi:hypothetical protein